MKQNLANFFWIVDSDHLDQVSEKLYGYMIGDEGEFIEDEIPSKIYDSGNYTLLKKEENKILIYQDFFGSQGIYHFNYANRHIFSNAFIDLLSYLKKESFNLSINLQFKQNYFIVNEVPFSMHETLINEITKIPRNSYVELTKESCSIKTINYEEETLDIDSQIAIDILDKWYIKWCKAYRNILRKQNYIWADLSGGIDTRINLSMFLYGKINKNSIFFKCNDPKISSYQKSTEDYEISTQIKNDFGIQGAIIRKYIQEITEFPEVIQVLKNVTLPNHPCQFGTHNGYARERYFHITGIAGDPAHGGNLNTWDKYISGQKKVRIKTLKLNEAKFFDKQAFETGTERYLSEIKAKYNNQIKTDEIFSNCIIGLELVCTRYHGPKVVDYYLHNNVVLSPYFDSLIHKIRCNNEKDSHCLLLPTVIFDRFCPKLLEYKLEKSNKRQFLEGTMAYSKEINGKYPRKSNPFDEIKGEENIIPTIFFYEHQKFLTDEIRRYLNENKDRVVEQFGEEIWKLCLDDIAVALENPHSLEITKIIGGVYFYLSILDIIS